MAGSWAAAQGMFVAVDSYPEADGTMFESCVLGIEKFVVGKYVCFMLELPAHRNIWPQALNHYAKLVRAGLEREIEKHCAFAWWEHVSR